MCPNHVCREGEGDNQVACLDDLGEADPLQVWADWAGAEHWPRLGRPWPRTRQEWMQKTSWCCWCCSWWWSWWCYWVRTTDALKCTNPQFYTNVWLLWFNDYQWLLYILTSVCVLCTPNASWNLLFLCVWHVLTRVWCMNKEKWGKKERNNNPKSFFFISWNLAKTYKITEKKILTRI